MAAASRKWRGLDFVKFLPGARARTAKTLSSRDIAAGCGFDGDDKWRALISRSGKLMHIMQSLQTIQQRINAACARTGRDPQSVQLIGASKTVEAARLEAYFAAGLHNFGENYIQEGITKAEWFEEHNLNAQWDFIGALQSNKAREAVAHFELIHSLDRMSLAKELDKEARKISKIQRVLLQVNVGDEESKGGINPKKLEELFRNVSELGNLSVEGLMSLPPYEEDAGKIRPYHRRLRELGVELSIGPELSMGMSNDFEVAIEEGATKIRIGTALFGERE